MGLAASQHGSTAQRIQAGVELMQGRRERMEDEVVVEIEPTGDEGFFGVFDGHNGLECAEFLKKNYIATFKEQESQRKGRKPSVERLLRRTSETLDSDYLKMAAKKDWVAGSTATVCFFRGNELYVANTGDSRCIAIINGRPWSLSTDHKPDVPDEKKRIEQCGAHIHKGRIEGVLAMSRAFGNPDLKKAQYLICDPDITKCNINSDLQYVILASDGLWDVMNAKEVTKYLKATQKEMSPEMQAQGLAKHAHQTGSRDNISVIVVRFNHKGKPIPASSNNTSEIPSNKQLDASR